MHIAFDGGAFQQGILGGIYQVARNFLNSAKSIAPDLRVTLVADPRQGLVRDAAMSGLAWRPDVKYAAIARSYDDPDPWPATDDAGVRFFVDDRLVPAVLEGRSALYRGPRPSRSFAVLSRASRPGDPEAPQRPHGVCVEKIVIGTEQREISLSGRDRRLSVGFFEDNQRRRWTDGAGFLSPGLFPADAAEVSVEVVYDPQDRYELAPGAGANAVMRARRARLDAAREVTIKGLAAELLSEGCQAWFGNHFTPAHLPGLVNVAWTYDMIPILFPQYFHADARLNFDENLAMFARADRVYAISERTRMDAISEARLAPEKVIAAGIAPDPALARAGAADVGKVLGKWSLRKHGYILAVATIEPRKNHFRMIQAYAALRARMVDCPDIVFVGSLGWNFQDFLNFREQNGLEGCAKLLSDLPGTEIAALYTGALFSPYLSVYEGFGLPVLEAMTCGAPVLTSDCSSMPEIAGGAALLVNPYDIDAMSEAFRRMTTDAPLRAELSAQGARRAKDYSWGRTSRVILDDLAALTGARP